MLRLKDGETQILAGLINKEDRQAVNSIPGLGEMPIIGRLFSRHSDTASKTEIVLLITPRVVRNIIRPESPIEVFSSGTESAISLERMEINQAETAKGSMAAVEGSTSAAPIEVKAQLEDLAMPPALGNVKLSLSAPSKVQSGQEFTVKVNLSAEGLQNALLDISFDPAKLRVVNVTEGDLLKKPDGKTQFLQQVQDKAGRINLSVIRQGNVQGDGMLASVTFQPVPNSASTTQLRVGAANFSNAAGKVLPFDSLPTATVEITK
jgi:general secretion pathway protein D